MIPVKADVEVKGSLPSTRKTKFGIGNASWVLQSLSDLYSNRELATTREYSTNAADANKERALLEGTDLAAIDVTLPSVMHPYFTVRDYGYGMSEDTLHEVYTQFGDSTKRTSNAFNGILGFGCKSALAYTNTFTVTSIHAGIKTVVVVHRNQDWDIEMDTLSMETTDAPSGTEVTVPVSDAPKFTHIAMDFYKFWLPGTVRLRTGDTGQWFEPEHAVGDLITEGLYYSTHYAQSYVVMGNVPYRINNPAALFTDTKMSSINFVAYVDNGDVEFTPSREDLKYTDHTISTLKKVIADFEAKIVGAAQKEISSAPTHYEAYRRWRKWTDRLGRRMFDSLTFKGDAFQDTFQVRGSKYDARAYYGGTQTIREWYVEHMEKTTFITEFSINLSSRHKKMAKDFVKMKGWDGSFFIFTSQKADEISSAWITKDRFVKWEDLKAALPKPPPKPRQAATGPGRVAGSWDFQTVNGWTYEKPLPDDTKGVYFITVREEKSVPVRDILRHVDPTGTVVVVPQNRLNKFNRENPEIQHFVKFAESKVVLDFETLLSDEAKTVAGYDHMTRSWVRSLDLGKLDDPEIAKIKSLLDREQELWKRHNANKHLASLLRMGYNVKEYTKQPKPSLLVKYPLLRELSPHRMPTYGIGEHVYLYMNAVHAQTKGNK